MSKTLKAAATGILLAMAGSAFADMRSIDAETQASIKLAEGFYEDVLIYRNLNNFSKYVGREYIQHAPAYGDGPVELIKAIAGELTADPGVRVDIYRTIAEGPYVAIHSVWTTSDGAEYVYVDIWRAEDGKLVEHWDHYQQVPEKAANANTMYQGPEANIYAKQNIEQNRERAIAVLNTFNHPSDTSAIAAYVSPDLYIQHNPGVADGIEAFTALLDGFAAEGAAFETHIAKSIAMGDMVLVHSLVTDPAQPDWKGLGFIDIFRFNDAGQIVEHWDIEEEQNGVSANSNGVFDYPAE